MRRLLTSLAASALVASVIGLAVPGMVYGEAKADGIDAIPQQPSWRPTEREALIMLDAVLGAAEETLGWDNIFYWVAIDKCILLIVELQPAYAAGSPERYFIDGALIDLSNDAVTMQGKINKGERVNPVAAEAKAAKARIQEIRTEVQAMIARAPTTKEPLPQWIGSGWERKRDKSRKEILRNWLEAETDENNDKNAAP